MEDLLERLFRVKKPIIGMVHLLPLPGAPRYDGRTDSIIERALADAGALCEGGVDGLLVENYGDIPYEPSPTRPETVTHMTLAANEVRKVADKPIGINVLRNGAHAALAIAHATKAQFIRVNAYAEPIASLEGIIEPVAHSLARVRKTLSAEDVKFFADVRVKHAAPIAVRPIEEVAFDAAERGMADAIIASGSRTGSSPELQTLDRIKSTVKIPVLIGSGLTFCNVTALLGTADGAIVGSELKVGGITENQVDVSRVKRFMGRVIEIRRNL